MKKFTIHQSRMTVNSYEVQADSLSDALLAINNDEGYFMGVVDDYDYPDTTKGIDIKQLQQEDIDDIEQINAAAGINHLDSIIHIQKEDQADHEAILYQPPANNNLGSDVVAEVNTKEGKIVIHKKSDPDFPGFYVSINGQDLVMVEFDSSNDAHAIRVWSQEDELDEPVYTQLLK